MTRTTEDCSPQEYIDLELRCPVQTGVLNPLRIFITTLARQMGFDDEQVEQIEMAVDEACANVIRHAYKHLGISPDLPAEEQSKDDQLRRACLLKLRVEAAEDCLRVSIIDTGIGLPSNPSGVDSVEEFEKRGGQGGLGLYIIRQFMDEVRHVPLEDGGTVLTMTKFLRPVAKNANG